MMYIVTILNGKSMALETAEIFPDKSLAEEYFCNILKTMFPEDCHNWEVDNFSHILEIGNYWCNPYKVLVIQEVGKC